MTAPQWFGDTIERGWSEALPRVGGYAGFGGAVREAPEDFRVEEIAAYEPSGSGSHLFIELTKRDLTTPALIALVARAFGVDTGDVGSAGLKDRHAVTTQWLSVNLEVSRRDPEAALAELDAEPSLRVERSSRHGHKLRTGHLRGNRFVIVVRDVDAGRLEAGALDALVARLSTTGMANYFGAQRFGRELDNVARGLSMLSGRERTGGGLRRLLVSAVQSAVFNAVTATRLALGAGSRVLEGDVLMRVESGGCFVSQDAALDQARLDAGELVVAGPLPGSQLLEAQGAPGWLEARLRRAVGLEAAASPAISDADAHSAWPGALWPIPAATREVSLRRAGQLARGARRAMMVRPAELAWRAVPSAPVEGALEASPAAVELRFALPAGSYATVLLHEFMGASADPGQRGGPVTRG